MNFETIPLSMRAYPQWVNHDKNKIPYDPKTGRPAKVSDPESWAQFETAERRSKATGLGLGFVFTENDPFVFIDFDKLDAPETQTEAMRWIAELDTYSEESPSGRGLHAIALAPAWTPSRNKSTCGHFEIYTKGRYATFTGKILQGSPAEPKESPALQKFHDSVMRKHETPKPKQSDTATTESEAEQMLGYISPDCDYQTWLEIGMALKEAGFDCSLFANWSSRGSKHKPGEPERKWKSFKRSGITMATLAKHAIDGGWERHVEHPEEVDISAFISTGQKKSAVPTTAEIRAIAKNSVLYPFIEEYEAVMVPSLPLELTFGKALVSVGLCLSGKTQDAFKAATGSGNELARVRIGGEALAVPPNFYCVNIAESASGKDVGKRFQKFVRKHKWGCAAGSPEGVADILSAKDTAVLSMSEMQNFFDARRWESKLNSFLTEVFNEYAFDISLSQRAKDMKPRRSDYCALHMLGAIQPEIMRQTASESALDNGFMGRCMFFAAPKAESAYYLPNEQMPDSGMDNLDRIAEALSKIAGRFEIDQTQIREKIKEYAEAGMPHKPLWSRLFNESVKKIAMILSISIASLDSDGISQANIRDAIAIAEWIYHQSIPFLDNARKDADEKAEDKYKRKIIEYIRATGERTKSEITARFHYVRKHMELDGIIRSMLADGSIIEVQEKKSQKISILYRLALDKRDGTRYNN